MPPATQVKVGNVIILDDNLFRVLKVMHITPGKGNAIVHTDLRNVKTGVKTEKRFRSSENVDKAEIKSRSMQFLYEGDGLYHFMDTENYEQYEISKDLLGDAVYFLVPEANFTVDVYEGLPLGITLPQRVTVTIAETDPAQKGGAGKYKAAKTELGLTVQVPLFLDTGEAIVVNTENMEYVERA